MTLESNTCSRCQGQIGNQIVRVKQLEGVFHPECFTCIDCNTPVAAKFFPDDDQTQPLCEYDYFRRNDLLCGTCNKALRGAYITALDKKYHTDHFTCSLCSVIFGPEDSYYEHNGDVYCHLHYSVDIAARCVGCEHAILKQYVEIGKLGSWHPDCYVIHKNWKIKVALPEQTEESEKAMSKNFDNLKQQQQDMEEKVYRMRQVLDAFEESSAFCISNMFLHVFDKDSIRMSDCLLLHVEALFTGVDDLCYLYRKYNQEYEYKRPAQRLCNKIIHFFKLLTRGHDFSIKKEDVPQEVLSLIKALAYYLKFLIRDALKAALRLDKMTSDTTAVKGLMDRLMGVASKGFAGRDRHYLINLKDATGRCRVCDHMIENECVKYGSYQWHMGCFQCNTCKQMLSAKQGAGLCDNGSFVICERCVDKNDNRAFQGFETVTELDQYAFLLRLELSKLCERLNITDLSSSLVDFYSKSRQLADKDAGMPEQRHVRSSFYPESTPDTKQVNSTDALLNRRVSRSLKSTKRLSTALGKSPNAISETAFPERSSSITSRPAPARLDSLMRRLDQHKDGTTRPTPARQRQQTFSPPIQTPERYASPVPSLSLTAAGRPRTCLSELSAMQYMIIRHAASMHIAPYVQGILSQKELRNMIAIKKSSIWEKFFTTFKIPGPKRSVKDGTFGVALEALTERTGVESNLCAGPSPIRIAAFIDDAITTMRQMDMSVEGVFRKNGNIRRLKELTEQLDSNPQDVDLSSETVVQIAALLKKFLREMPDPLLTHRLYALFLQVSKLEQVSHRKLALHLACCMLPRCNRDTLEALFLFLRWSASFSDMGSLMDLKNLARVIAPNILAPATKDPAKFDSPAVIDTVEALLESFEEFCLVPEPLERYLEDSPTKDVKLESLLKKTEEMMSKGFMSVSMPDLTSNSPRYEPAPPPPTSIYAQLHVLPFPNQHPSSDFYPAPTYIRHSSLTQNTSQPTLPMPQM